jgi:hypothetical protein
MSKFAGDIQIVCLGSLAVLIVYTLWLSRYRGLDGHLTVRWLLIQGAALLTIIFWRWLPIFSLTSALQDRELLLMVTVLLFAFVVFLMLDLLVRSSRHSAQIKRLTQELAVQRERIDRLDPIAAPKEAAEDSAVAQLPPVSAVKVSRGSTTACIWIVACIGFFILETFAYDSRAYPEALRKFLMAAYLG